MRAHSPMCYCFGPACLLEVGRTLKAVIDLKTFFNDLFVLCLHTGQGFPPPMALLDSPRNRSELCKTQLEKLKR